MHECLASSSFLMIARIPGRVTELPRTNDLQVGLDEQQVRMTFPEFVWHWQAVPACLILMIIVLRLACKAVKFGTWFAQRRCQANFIGKDIQHCPAKRSNGIITHVAMFKLLYK